MNAQDFFDVLRAKPFVPFRIVATDGRTHDVRHPDQVLVLRTRVIWPIASDGGVPDRSEHLSLIHVLRLEELASPSTVPSPGEQANGGV